jgi:hypothetical protein
MGIKNRKIPFGKYKGREVYEIINEDLPYISHLICDTKFQLNEFEMECYKCRLVDI